MNIVRIAIIYIGLKNKTDTEDFMNNMIFYLVTAGLLLVSAAMYWVELLSPYARYHNKLQAYNYVVE